MHIYIFTYMHIQVDRYIGSTSVCTFSPGDEELGSDENSSEVSWTAPSRWDGVGWAVDSLDLPSGKLA